MTSRFTPLALSLFIGLAATGSGRADSLASSASSAGSASSGSLSDSVHGSSRSSSGDNKVADGDYRVIEVAALAGRPGMLRLRMQDATTADAGDDRGFLLDLPARALGSGGLAVGELVAVRNRAYGLAFARAATQETFFLALDDAWRSDLAARPVTL